MSDWAPVEAKEDANATLFWLETDIQKTIKVLIYTSLSTSQWWREHVETIAGVKRLPHLG